MSAKTIHSKQQGILTSNNTLLNDTFTKQQTDQLSFTGTRKPIRLYLNKALDKKIDQLIETHDPAIVEELVEHKRFDSIKNYLVSRIVDSSWAEDKKIETIKTLKATPILSKIVSKIKDNSLDEQDKGRKELFNKLIADPECALEVFKKRGIKENHQLLALE
ncbi:MAG: hypothetical protein AB7V50_09835, partial [Vampirovibrionia bacterium]